VVASIWPNYVAGQRVSAADLQAGQFAIVYKAAATDRSSTTTFADDPDLSFALAANAVYFVEFYPFFAGSLGKLKTNWTVPAGVSSTNRSVMGPASNATDANADNISMRSGVHAYGTSVVYGNRTAGITTPSLNQTGAIETSLVITTTAGTCALAWAQNASNANTTRMAAGSFARALRIA
jgi:hypothetical protein